MRLRTPSHPLSRRAITTGIGALAIVLGCAVPGCQFSIGRKSAPLVVPEGEHAVSIRVLQGAQGGTMAFIPVWINGRGPFTFAIDTGASHTLIDRSLADQLDLPATGKTLEMSGVTASAEADQVRVAHWRIGDVELPAYTFVSMPLARLDRESGMRGLLGSDILSRFDTITLDYSRQVLLLR